MTVSAVINATATTTTPAMIPAVLSDSAHVEDTLSASDAAVEKCSNENSTKVQNPQQNSYAGTGCRHYTMPCLTLNSNSKCQGPSNGTLDTQCILRECLAAPSRPSPVSRLFHTGCTSS